MQKNVLAAYPTTRPSKRLSNAERRIILSAKAYQRHFGKASEWAWLREKASGTDHLMASTRFGLIMRDLHKRKLIRLQPGGFAIATKTGVQQALAAQQTSGQ